MYKNTSKKCSKHSNLESESGRHPGSLGDLDSTISVEEIYADDQRKRTTKDIATQSPFNDTGVIQRTKSIASNSKVKYLSWCTMTTNTILILICVAVLSERVYECFYRYVLRY